MNYFYALVEAYTVGHYVLAVVRPVSTLMSVACQYRLQARGHDSRRPTRQHGPAHSRAKTE